MRFRLVDFVLQSISRCSLCVASRAIRCSIAVVLVKWANGLITIAIRARFEYDSTTIRLQHATTRYEVFRSLAYEIVYENQW